MQSPIRFRPYLRPMVWGGRRLGDLLGKALPTAELYGEAWEISDHPSHHSLIETGSDAGRTLHDLMQHDSEQLLGRKQSENRAFPWLVKYLDACDWLSVQVHPDDAAAATLWPGEGGKTEAWFILDARPESKVYAGLKPGVDEQTLRQALTIGTVADCLHQFTPRAGDCLFLPAGTVHAVGGGVVMAEVQQTSDATFRLFDWNRVDAQGRSRTLHIEQALACIDWNAGPVQPVHATGYPTRLGETPDRGAVWQSLVRCRFFHLDYVSQREPFRLAGGKLQVVLGLHGKALIETNAGTVKLACGDTVLTSASQDSAWCVPMESVGVLVASLPAEEAMRKAE